MKVGEEEERDSVDGFILFCFWLFFGFFLGFWGLILILHRERLREGSKPHITIMVTIRIIISLMKGTFVRDSSQFQ